VLFPGVIVNAQFLAFGVDSDAVIGAGRDDSRTARLIESVDGILLPASPFKIWYLALLQLGHDHCSVESTGTVMVPTFSVPTPAKLRGFKAVAAQRAPSAY
jgi:hypothetical protein